ncbi:hypothetical protein ES702_03627 [subsurface metagenome]
MKFIKIQESEVEMKKNKKVKKIKKFKGIESPNYTQAPNVYLDELMANLTGSEFKVLMYITRRTFGFDKKSDNISLNQITNGIVKKDGTILDKGTGLSKSSVQGAIKGLVDKNIVIKEKRNSKEKGLEPTNYSLKFRKNLLDPYGKNCHSPMVKIAIEQKKVLQKKDFNNKERIYSREDKELIEKTINYLNDKTKKNFRSNNIKTQKLIKARSNEGYVFDDFKKVIDIKTKEWLKTEYNKFLRPETLFGGKFEGYLNESKIEGVETESDLKTKQANKCYISYNNGEDCMVEGTIRLHSYCNYCKKLLDQEDIPEKILIKN